MHSLNSVINLDSEEIKDQLERKNLLHRVKSIEPVPDVLDLYWKKFKEYYWLILILSFISVFSSASFGFYYLVIAFLLLTLVLMSFNIAYYSDKISGKRSNIVYAFLGILTFSFPIGMMTIYFAVQNLYIKAKGKKIPNAQKLLVRVGIIFAIISYLALLSLLN